MSRRDSVGKTIAILGVVFSTWTIIWPCPSTKADLTTGQDIGLGATQRALSEWQELTSVARGPLEVRWDQMTGTPVTVFGRIATGVEGVSEQVARQFLSRYQDLFGLKPDLSDLTLVQESESLAGRHFRFEQRYKGLPVYDGGISIHFDATGFVRAVNNDYVRQVRVASIIPGVPADAAVEVVTWHVGVASLREREESSSELLIYPGDPEARLAWRVVIPALRPLGTWEAIVDAQSGELITEPRDINRYSDGQGRVYGFVNAVVATQNNGLTDQRDSDFAVPAEAYTLVTLRELDGSGYLNGSFVSTSGTPRWKRAFSFNGQFLYLRSDDRFEEVMAYYYMDYCQRYIQSLGFSNVNNRQQVVAVNTVGADNSFYNPKSRQITFGSGGVDDAEDAEVIWHE